MRVVITLSEEEIKEAILEYVENHQSDVLVHRDKPGPPEMSFRWNPNDPPGKRLAVDITSEGEVQGRHPYR